MLYWHVTVVFWEGYIDLPTIIPPKGTPHPQKAPVSWLSLDAAGGGLPPLRKLASVGTW